MGDLPGWLKLTHDDAWTSPHQVRIDLTFRSAIMDGSTWLRDAPSLFDTRHDATARFADTNRGVTPTILGEVTYDLLSDSIGMGYTDLGVNEKRAVVADGRVLRLWPAEFDAKVDAHWFVLTADDDGSPVGVGAGFGLGPGHQLHLACKLSRLMGGRAMILARALERHYWH